MSFLLRRSFLRWKPLLAQSLGEDSVRRDIWTKRFEVMEGRILGVYIEGINV